MSLQLEKIQDFSRMERTTKGKNIVMLGMIDLLRKPCGAVPIRTGCDIPAGSSVFTETFRKQTGCCRSGTDQCNNLRLERRQPRQCSTNRAVPCIIPHGSGKHNAFVVFSRFLEISAGRKKARGVFHQRAGDFSAVYFSRGQYIL